MTTHQFFIRQSQIDGNRSVTIRGGDAQHMSRVLRLRRGSQVRLVDETQRLYLATVERISDKVVHVSITESVDCALEQARVSVIQGIPRLPKADLIVQKLAELGIGKLVFVPMERTPYPDGFERIEKRLGRLNAIAVEAAKQCGRRCIPGIGAAKSIDEAIGSLPADARVLVANERGADKKLRDIISATGASWPVTIIVGPEGGFSDDELELLSAPDIQHFSLGRNILRTETAAIVAAALVLYELGEI